MELVSAILGDIACRSMTFMVDRYWKTPSSDENLRRIHQLLLRIHIIVEEAEQRHITNQGMIRKLELLREQMFRGFYVLDAFRCRATGGKNADDNDEVSHPFALSKFNRAKRIRFSAGSNTPIPNSDRSVSDLRQMVCALEMAIGDTREFVVFLMGYPPMYRQPYTPNHYMDRCMFSRRMEREHVISFLTHAEALGTAENVQVLPIIGPLLVGKSTLVEHVCNDERVRNHFSLILYYSGHGLEDIKTETLNDSFVTKHRNGDVEGRLLVIIELLGDVDDATCKKFHYTPPGKYRAHEIKIIITSRSEKISRLGTTDALKLKKLPFEAYWYFFKVLAFGGEDPDQHPKLASMAMEIATLMKCCFLCAHIGGALLRDNFNARFWRMFLAFSRKYTEDQCPSLVDCNDIASREDHHQYVWAMANPTPAKYFLLRDSYQKTLVQDDVPKITLIDLLSGSVTRRGKFEVLLWKSNIPPCYSYISNCVM